MARVSPSCLAVNYDGLLAHVRPVDEERSHLALFLSKDDGGEGGRADAIPLRGVTASDGGASLLVAFNRGGDSLLIVTDTCVCFITTPNIAGRIPP